MIRFASAQDYETASAVATEYPAATKIVEVDGGWMVFETVTDYQAWLGQE